MADEDLGLVAVNDSDLGLIPDGPARGVIKAPPSVAENIAKAFDYTGGLTRAAVAATNPAVKVSELFTGKQISKLKEDFARAVNGKAPTTSEYLGRAGMPEGLARSALGFAGDVATDIPYLGIASRAISPASKWGRVAQKAAGIATAPISETSKGIGRKTYNWAFNKIDRHLEDYGKKPLSDVLWENGRISGTARNVENQMMELAGKMKSARDKILADAESAGAKISNEEATQIASEYVTGLREYPRFEAGSTIQSLDDLVSAYSSKPPIGVVKANDLKMDLYRAAGDKAYKIGTKSSEEKNVLQKLGEGYKNKIGSATDSVLPGKGAELSNINEDLGTILTAQTPIDREVKSALSKNPITPVDALAVGGSWAMKQDPAIAATIFAGKKAADLAKTTWAKTNAGKLMYSAGESLLPDTIARQTGVWSLRGKRNNNEN